MTGAVRMLLGQVCQQLGDDAGAELEFDAALRFFQRLSATRHRSRGRAASAERAHRP
jgi:Flp pilus assembly protein TadD